MRLMTMPTDRQSMLVRYKQQRPSLIHAITLLLSGAGHVTVHTLYNGAMLGPLDLSVLTAQKLNFFNRYNRASMKETAAYISC